MPLINDFFIDIDSLWTASSEGKILLRILGCSALMLQTDYERGTKDSDVLETANLTAPVKKRLLELAGRGTDLHSRHKLYIEFVPSGLPLLPQKAIYHPLDLNADLLHFELEVLDVVDVVISKLKRFHADDRSDIDAMIAKDLVSHDRLLERFRNAVDCYADGAHADLLPKCVENLHTVERDSFAVPESEIDLPEWVDR